MTATAMTAMTAMTSEAAARMPAGATAAVAASRDTGAPRVGLPSSDQEGECGEAAQNQARQSSHGDAP